MSARHGRRRPDRSQHVTSAEAQDGVLSATGPLDGLGAFYDPEEAFDVFEPAAAGAERQPDALFDVTDLPWQEPEPPAASAAALEADDDAAPVATEDAEDLESGAADGPEPGAEDGPEEHARRAKPVRRRRAGRKHKAFVETPEPVVETPHREPSPALLRVRAALANGSRTALAVVLIIVLLMAGLFGLTVGVNALARWNARRAAAASAAGAASAIDNLLVIGVRDGVAVGFTAMKVERANKRVLGIAIPDGAFVEVPGQGFERIGSSYVSGVGVSMDAVSNYLGVPFRRYVVVDGATYQSLLSSQNVAALMSRVTATDLTAAQRATFSSYFASVKTKDVWIVPLPVKPVAVGDQRYFEPQRAQVADLLLQWWGVKISEQKSTPRVIVYNGVGTPGLAGLAAQQLIRTGFRVVNSGNAQNFNYKTTQVLLYHGTQAEAESVRAALGVGRVQIQSAPQELTDMIVIIGADYRPPVDAGSTVPTEGVQ